jgi:hypothetical protein
LEAVTEAPAARQRRQRSATESLLSIALLLEAILVFFVTLVVFGLRVLPAALAFGGGGVLFVLLLLDTRLVRRPAGVWLGWLLQAVLIAIGVIVPLMYFVGALFLAIWIFCFVTGRRLDRNTADYFSSTTERTTTEE